jgi:Flp pilus assembly protein TadD
MRTSSLFFDTQTLPVDADRTRKDAERFYIEAKRHLDAGRCFEAICSLNEAVRHDPDNAKLHRLLGDLLALQPGCDQASREHYRKAVELDPYDVDSHLRLADLLEEAGLPLKARKVYEKVIDIVPDNEVALRKLGGITSLPSFF